MPKSICQYLFVVVLCLVSVSSVSNNLLYTHGFSDEGDHVFHTVMGSQFILVRPEGVLFSVDTTSHHSADLIESQVEKHPRVEWIWKWVGANQVQPEVKEESQTLYHEYRSKGEEHRLNQRLVKKIIYKGLYDHIDLVIYSNKGNFKYDWVVHPGGDPADIRWKYEGGASQLEDGSIGLPNGLAREKAPITYQLEGSKLKEISSSYLKDEEGIYHYQLGEYNKNQRLVIDPEIIAGSLAMQSVYADHVTDGDHIYACSTGLSSPEGFNTPLSFEIGVASPSGYYQMEMDLSNINYLVTFNSNTITVFRSIDYYGSRVVLAGYTASPGFPTTSGAYQEDEERGNLLVVLSNQGDQLIHSSYFFWQDNRNAGGRTFTVNGSSQEYSNGFVRYDEENDRFIFRYHVYHYDSEIISIPGATHYGPDSQRVAVVMAVSSDLSEVERITTFAVSDDCRGSIFDPSNDAIRAIGFNLGDILIEDESLYLGGCAQCPLDFLPDVATLDGEFSGEENGVILKLNRETLELESGTYLSSEELSTVRYLQFQNDQLFVAGFADSMEDDSNLRFEEGDARCFVNIYSPDLTEVLEQYRFGTDTPHSTGRIRWHDLVVDACGNFYGSIGVPHCGTDCADGMMGWPLVNNPFQTEGWQWVFGYDRVQNNLQFSGFLGGGNRHIAFRNEVINNKWIFGICNEPIVFGPLAAMPLSENAYLTEIDPVRRWHPHFTVIDLGEITNTWVEAAGEVTVSPACDNDELTLTSSTPGDEYQWLLNNEPIASGQETQYLAPLDGIQELSLIVTDSSTCNKTDTLLIELNIEPSYSQLSASLTASSIDSCAGPQTAFLELEEEGATSFEWVLPDNSVIENVSEVSYNLEPGESYMFEVAIRDEVCDSTITLTHSYELRQSLENVVFTSSVLSTDLCGTQELFYEVQGEGMDEIYWQANGMTSSEPSFYPTLPPGTHEVLLEVNNIPCDQRFTEVIEVEVNPINTDGYFIPVNIFTPNGDNKNDELQLYFGPDEYVSSWELIITNRWGQTVFESDRPKDQWDGRIDGNPASEGTYFYTLRYQTNCTTEQQTLNGTVQVNR